MQMLVVQLYNWTRLYISILLPVMVPILSRSAPLDIETHLLFIINNLY